MLGKFIDTSQGRVFYWISDNWRDNRKTIVFLHGLTANHTMFHGQIDYFKEKYNIIAWDAPAHGKSRPYEDFTYSTSVLVLKEIIERHTSKSVFMVGQSMGGFIVQSFLLRYPSLVSGFVAIDTAPFGEKYYSKSDKWWLRQIKWMASLYPLNVMKKAIARQVSASKSGYENMLSMLEPYTKIELCNLMAIGYAGFLEDNADLEITCPVLIILGEKDRTGKIKSYTKEWVRTTNYPCVIIKNAAHNSNVDKPKEVNEEIDKFLKDL